MTGAWILAVFLNEMPCFGKMSSVSVTRVVGPHDDLLKKHTNKHKGSVIWGRKLSVPLKWFKSDLSARLYIFRNMSEFYFYNIHTFDIDITEKLK